MGVRQGVVQPGANVSNLDNYVVQDAHALGAKSAKTKIDLKVQA